MLSAILGLTVGVAFGSYAIYRERLWVPVYRDEYFVYYQHKKTGKRRVRGGVQGGYMPINRAWLSGEIDDFNEAWKKTPPGRGIVV